MAKDLIRHHTKQVKMLDYLISRKQLPTVKGTMYFGTWIETEGTYFDTVHFPDNLVQYLFLGGECYLLLGNVEVDYYFRTVTITKMAIIPFAPDPSYIDAKDQYKTQNQNKEMYAIHKGNLNRKNIKLIYLVFECKNDL